VFSPRGPPVPRPRDLTAAPGEVRQGRPGRLAAMSALAAKWLARPDSRVMALIGNGAQSESQAIAYLPRLPVLGVPVLVLGSP
jgi:hypothetical protein